MTKPSTDPSPADKARSRWGTQSGSGNTNFYDRRRFYIEATNEHDHYTNARVFSRPAAEAMGMPETVALPMELLAQIRKVVDDPRTDYRSIQDVFRDAVRHRLHDVAEMLEDGDFLTFLNEEAYRQDLVTIEKEDAGWERTVAFYEDQVDKFAREGNPHGIADIINLFTMRPPPLRFRKRWLKAKASWEKTQEAVEAKT